jgi:cellobiose phosphorylase
MIAGIDAPNFGEAKNSWLTGTAAWTFANVSQHILGMRPELDGLSVKPCLPEKIKGFTLTRRFRGATYFIEAVNSNAKSAKGETPSLTVDGIPVKGAIIPYVPGKTEYRVKVEV